MSENYSQLIWNIADQLRGVYKPHQYGTATLPFVVLRRMECQLDGHREEVRELAATALSSGVLDAQLRSRYNLHFHNTSKHTLDSILGEQDHLAANLKDYLAAFSPNVRDIFERFKFAETVDKLDEKDRLYLVVQQFAQIDFSPESVSNFQMGQIFEHLIWRFNTVSNETAGEHFTPRDAIRLMVDILLAPEEDLATPGIIRSVYDPTAGTGGMLSVTEERIKEMNPEATVDLAGQELNDESYAICKGDMISKGQPVNAIQLGDTLADDKHEGRVFDYCLSNPPYGGDWKASADVVRKEFQKGSGRFVGLPRISDGQMLFLQHLKSKMRPVAPNDPHSGGRAAIVLNGSPLFTGGAGSGESEIRRSLIESDLVDAIVALPTNMFYNTGIATYVWILDNNKPSERRNKIQLIDATKRWTKLRKNLGSKNREIGEEDREAIVRLYSEFVQTDECKILEPADFGFWEITIEQPLQLRFDVTAERIDAAMETKAIAKLDSGQQESIRAALSSLEGQSWTNRDAFLKAVRKELVGRSALLPTPAAKALWQTIGEHDDDADIITNAKGKPEPDTSLRDTEIVPFRDDIKAYFEREVKPYVPKAWIDESKTKVGYEIPFTRIFYIYVPPRPLEEIDAELNQLAKEIIELLSEVEK